MATKVAQQLLCRVPSAVLCLALATACGSARRPAQPELSEPVKDSASSAIPQENRADSDGDGVPASIDCDDNDATIVPGAPGCAIDTEHPRTWIAKLAEPGQLAHAVKQLTRLAHPWAIAPLIESWRRQEHSPRLLRAVVEIAESKAHKGPHWQLATPALLQALARFNPRLPPAIENSIIASEALGRAGIRSAAPALLRVATLELPPDSQGNVARISAIRSLGRLRAGEAVQGLSAVLQSRAPTKSLVRAAAADALGKLADPRALPALVHALYAHPSIFPFIRRGIVSIGPAAIPVLRRVLRRKDPAVEKFARDNGFDQGCDRGMGPGTRCTQPSVVLYKAAFLLGDLRASEAIGELSSLLAATPRPVYYERDGAPRLNQHLALLMALRKIGEPAAAAGMRAVYENPRFNPRLRTLAIDSYSQIATSRELLPTLASEAGKSAPDARSLASTLAYGRLASTPADLAKLTGWLQRLQGPGYDRSVYEGAWVMARVGVHCKSQPACLFALIENDAEFLRQARAETGLRASQQLLRRAVRERALTDLAKLGKKARGQLDGLLQLVGSSEPALRERTIAALARVAPRPCHRCGRQLRAHVVANRKHSSRQAMSEELRILLLWLRRAR